jgi:hypothetical protein
MFVTANTVCYTDFLINLMFLLQKNWFKIIMFKKYSYVLVILIDIWIAEVIWNTKRICFQRYSPKSMYIIDINIIYTFHIN